MSRLICSLLLAFGVVVARAALPTVKELASVLQPLRTDRISLAPDGQHLAYTVRTDSDLNIMLVDVNDPRKRASINAMSFRSGETQQLSFFGWAKADCLVFGVMQQGGESLYSVGCEGGKVRKIVDGVEFDIDYDTNAGSSGVEGSSESNDADAKSAEGDSDKSKVSIEGEDSPSDAKLTRSPKALGFSSEKPGIVMVETTGFWVPLSKEGFIPGRVIETELFEVDVVTGKKTLAFRGTFEGRVIYDRQYRPRLVHMQTPAEAVQSIELPSRSFWKTTDSLKKVMDKRTAESFTWTPERYFGPRSIPLAFDQDPEILYFATNEGRDTFGLFVLNLRSKQQAPIVSGDDLLDMVSPSTLPGSGAGLVFDRITYKLVGVQNSVFDSSTRWLDKELAEIQVALEKRLPRRTVQILDWDEKRSRILLSSSSSDDPGRFFIFDRQDGRLTQFARRAPWLDIDDVNKTELFGVNSEQGLRLTGYVTKPREALLKPPPLLIYLHDAPWTRAMPGYNTEVQALARMGFLVLQINFRGSAGFGLKHCMAMREHLDQVPLQDIRAAMVELGKRTVYDRKRVVLFGNGFGGYLAMRAVELFPDEFRCAIALNAPIDLADAMDSSLESAADAKSAFEMSKQIDEYFKQVNTPINLENPKTLPRMPTAAAKSVDFMNATRRAFFGDLSRLREISILRKPDALTRPLLIIQSEDDPFLHFKKAVALKDMAAARGIQVELVKLESSYSTGDAEARAQVFDQILGFLNANIYEYDVKVGPVEIRK